MQGTKCVSKLCSYVKSEDFKKEKHVPVIDVPDDIKAGVPFDVKITVGKEIPHPNKTEHYISWIALHFIPEGSNFSYNLGRMSLLAHGESTLGADMGPVHSNPKTIFNVEIDKSGTLISTCYCNIHGLWESSKDISL